MRVLHALALSALLFTFAAPLSASATSPIPCWNQLLRENVGEHARARPRFFPLLFDTLDIVASLGAFFVCVFVWFPTRQHTHTHTRHLMNRVCARALFSCVLTPFIIAPPLYIKITHLNAYIYVLAFAAYACVLSNFYYFSNNFCIGERNEIICRRRARTWSWSRLSR